MNRSARVFALAYGVSLASLAAAVLLRWLLDPVLGDTLPLVTLFAAIGAAVWIGGHRPAVLVTILGFLVCNYLFITPRGELSLSDPRNLVGLFLYLVTAFIIIGLGEACRSAQHHHRVGEESARQQAELMRITLASIGDGVITTDPDARVTSMNSVAEALTGWTNKEAAGVPLTLVFRIVNEATRQDVDNPALRALKNGVIVGLANHTVLIAKDGTERPIDDSAAPIRRQDGEIVGSILVFRDITERHRAEAQNREAQQQITTTLESVTDGFMRYDRDWRIVYVNAEAERINRLARSEMLGRNVWEVFPTLAGTKFEANFRRAVAERVTIEFENYYEPFGRWYSLKGYPTDDGGLTTFIRDITAQKESENALRASEERSAFVRRSSGVGFWYCDLPFDVLQWDELVKAHFHLKPDAAVTIQTFYDRIHPDDREPTRLAIERSIAGRTPYDTDFRTVNPDTGAVKWVRAIGRTFYAADGNPIRFDGVTLDVSDRKRAEQEIVRLAAESERQRRLYETILTNTPDFVYVFSLDHKVVYANDALIKMWGRGREGAIGKTFLEIGYEPWHAAMHDREIDQVRATREPIRGEVPFNGTHGRRQYDYIFVPIIGANGEVEAVAGTTRDVTERKEAEEQLRRNHDTFFALIQNNPFGMFAVDADFGLRQVSLGAQKVFETVHPLLGRDFAEVLRIVWQEPFASEAIGRFRHTLETGEPYSSPSTVERRADIGSLEAYDWRIERISLPDGRYGVVCYFYDLSERQRWEATLLENEERLRLATEAAELGIWTWQPDSDVVVWENERPYEIFALPRTEPPITAARFKTDFLYPEDTEMFETALGRTIHLKLPLLCECRIHRTNGQTRWVEFTGRAVEGEGEEKVRLIGTVQDITARKEAEAAIRESEARHSFAVTLSDTIRPLSDPVEVQAHASRMLGQHLRANRVVYFEISGDEYVVERDYTAGVQPLVGRYPVSSFGPALLAVLLDGRTVIEADATTEPDRAPAERAAFAAIQVRGHVDVPLVKSGRFVAGMTVHVSDRREWTPAEVAIIEETAERTWAAVERVRAEQEVLRLAAEADRQRRLFDTALSNTTDYNFLFNLDERLVYANQPLLALWGRTADQALGKTLAELDYPAHAEAQVVRNLRRVVATRETVRDETPYTGPTGASGYYEYILAPVLEDGRVILVAGSSRDVTARKEAEMRVRESEERFRLMADAAPVMIWMSGTDKLVNWYNQPWLDFTGRSMVEEVGHGATEVVHPDDLIRTVQIYTAAFEARAPFSMEYRLRRHDGEYRWMICNAVPRYRADGEFEGYIGSCLDVTDYKIAQAKLQAADRRKDEFLATLAHELRNPLAPIRNGLQIIRRAGATGTIEHARTMMERQLTQMVRLVDDLLDVSRVTSGKMELRKERVELKSVIDAAVETSRPAIDDAGHELSVIVPDDPIHLDGDATRLAQVVSNLLNNSAKYTHRGGHIRLTVRLENEMAVVSVVDDGIGIPPYMLEKVFEMFSQVDRALEKTTGGLGIGLSLVKGLVEMHGGTIEARSEGEGRGSEFVVRLPVVLSAVQKVAQQVAEVPMRSSSRRRILVADDNVDSAESLGKLLELHGNDVSIANDGMQALEMAETFRPDMILLDIGMPKLNGYETCRRIREQPWGKKAIIIALTGWGQDEDRRRSQEAGFDHHMVKPVDDAALVKAGLTKM